MPLNAYNCNLLPVFRFFTFFKHSFMSKLHTVKLKVPTKLY